MFFLFVLLTAVCVADKWDCVCDWGESFDSIYQVQIVDSSVCEVSDGLLVTHWYDAYNFLNAVCDGGELVVMIRYDTEIDNLSFDALSPTIVDYSIVNSTIEVIVAIPPNQRGVNSDFGVVRYNVAELGDTFSATTRVTSTSFICGNTARATNHLAFSCASELVVANALEPAIEADPCGCDTNMLHRVECHAPASCESDDGDVTLSCQLIVSTYRTSAQECGSDGFYVELTASGEDSSTVFFDQPNELVASVSGNGTEVVRVYFETAELDQYKLDIFGRMYVPIPPTADSSLSFEYTLFYRGNECASRSTEVTERYPCYDCNQVTTGHCCVPFASPGDNSCQLQTRAECTALGGTFIQTHRDSCDANMCPDACTNLWNCIDGTFPITRACNTNTGFCVDLI